MTHILGILLAGFIIYHASRYIFGLVAFFAFGDFRKLPVREWYKTGAAICLVAAVHYLLPPPSPEKAVSHLSLNRDVAGLADICPEYGKTKGLCKRDGPEPVAATERRIYTADILAHPDQITDSLVGYKINDHLKRLEIWSLKRTDRLDYHIPSHGLWYLVDKLPLPSGYKPQTRDIVQAETSMSCRVILLRRPDKRVERVCDLTAPVTIAADIVKVVCSTRVQLKNAEPLNIPCIFARYDIQRVRFPTLLIKIRENGVSLEMHSSGISGKIREAVMHELFLPSGAGGEWKSFPVELPLEEFRRMSDKPLRIRLRSRASDVAIIGNYPDRAEFEGESTSFVKHQAFAAVNYKGDDVTGLHYRSAEGVSHTLRNFATTGLDFITQKRTGIDPAWLRDAKLVEAIKDSLGDHLEAAGGSDVCAEIHSSQLTGGLARYAGLELKSYKDSSERDMKKAQWQHVGLADLALFNPEDICRERLIVLEMMASHIKNIMPSYMRNRYFYEDRTGKFRFGGSLELLQKAVEKAKQKQDSPEK